MPKYATLGIALAVAALATFGGYLLFKTEPKSLTIIGFSWERKIDIEELRTVVEEGSYVPSGGREISRHRHCEEDDDGDEDCTTIYTYEIERWFYNYSIKTSKPGKKPYWPTVGRLSSIERIGGHHELYMVYLKDGMGKDYYYSCRMNEWFSFGHKEIVIARISRFGIRKLIKLEKE